MSQTGNVNLNDERFKLELTTAETPEDAEHRRWKDKIVFISTFVVVGVAFFIALYFVVTDRTPDTQRYSWSALTGIVGGMIGYKVK